MDHGCSGLMTNILWAHRQNDASGSEQRSGAARTSELATYQELNQLRSGFRRTSQPDSRQQEIDRANLIGGMFRRGNRPRPRVWIASPTDSGGRKA